MSLPALKYRGAACVGDIVVYRVFAAFNSPNVSRALAVVKSLDVNQKVYLWTGQYESMTPIPRNHATDDFDSAGCWRWPFPGEVEIVDGKYAITSPPPPVPSPLSATGEKGE